MTFTRSGITANLVPTADFNPSTANTISLIDTFQESTNLLPLASHAPAPGNQVAHLVFTLSGSASAGSSIAITLDPSVTLLSDEGGNTSESPANGTLVLVDGAINIPSQMGTAPIASMAPKPAETVPSSIQREQSLRPARFLNNAKLTAGSTRFSPRTSNYTGTTNHDAAFAYDEAGDVLNDDKGRSFTYDALSMTTGATAPMTNGGGNRTFAYIYTADDERIALVETLPSNATTATWTLRGLDNHLLRTWTNSSTSGWSWREDDNWRGAALLANESSIGVRHYGLDHLGSPAILTDALAHPIGSPLAFDAFGNGGATGAGMLEYTGHERDSFNVGSSPGTVILPDYLHARYYDSTRGRFLSADPNVIINSNLRMPQRWNRYTYGLNNPIKYMDENGREITIAVQRIGGIVNVNVRLTVEIHNANGPRPSASAWQGTLQGAADILGGSFSSEGHSPMHITTTIDAIFTNDGGTDSSRHQLTLDRNTGLFAGYADEAEQGGSKASMGVVSSKWVAHEFAHWFGLPDDVEVPPTSEDRQDDNLMNHDDSLTTKMTFDQWQEIMRDYREGDLNQGLTPP